MINQIQIASEPKDSNLASTLAHETRKNNMFRIISVVLVSALLAVGIVVMSSCNGDKDDPAADGKTVGQELCNCFKAFEAAAKDLDEDDDKWDAAEDALDNCVDNLEKKYEKFIEKYGNENEDHPYWAAFLAELRKCSLEYFDWFDLMYR